MNFDENTILTTQQQTRFELLYIEKVLRLMGILEQFFNDSVLKDKYALKGGTALNLFYFDLPRLSVDIDLNYIGCDRELMQNDREWHEKHLKKLLETQDYILKRVPSEHAGGKWRLGYRSFAGILQNIELDINYMHRIPLLEMQTKSSHLFGKQQVNGVKVLDIHELAAGKICAFIARSKPRDLFDAYQLLTSGILDKATLRMCFVIYAAFNKIDFSKVESFSTVPVDGQQFRQELVATLADGVVKGSPDDYMQFLIQKCKKKMSMVLPFTHMEKEFLESINLGGEIKPDLITDSETMRQIIMRHPMLQWKVFNVRKHYGL